jgi:hypothetical protein
MGCKFCKSLSYDKEQAAKRKKHRRSKHRKRRGKRSGRHHHHHHHHSRRYEPTEEIIHNENPSSQDDLNNSQYEMKPIQSITNDTVSEHSVVVEAFVDIEFGDSEALSNHGNRILSSNLLE